MIYKRHGAPGRSSRIHLNQALSSGHGQNSALCKSIGYDGICPRPAPIQGGCDERL